MPQVSVSPANLHNAPTKCKWHKRCCYVTPTFLLKFTAYFRWKLLCPAQYLGTFLPSVVAIKASNIIRANADLLWRQKFWWHRPQERRDSGQGLTTTLLKFLALFIVCKGAEETFVCLQMFIVKIRLPISVAHQQFIVERKEGETG